MATSYQRSAYDCRRKLYILLVNALIARQGVDVRIATLNVPYMATVKVVIHVKTKCMLYFPGLLFVFIIALILEIFTYCFTHQRLLFWSITSMILKVMNN